MVPDSRIVLILAILFHIITTIYTYRKGEQLEKITSRNYFDIIHHSFPDYSQFHHLKNIITALILLPIIFSNSVQQITKDVITIAPIIIFIRSILTSVTILPSTRTSDIPKTHHFLDYFIGDNHDRMFSGHVASVAVLSFLLFKWEKFNLIALLLFNLFHAFVVVVTRSHYTIDVLNSAIITLSLCKIYLI